ncbi:hypothetical protein BDQ17DRAFT_1333333 [Cyathus striatus]|nr:hypothetical protein BDQ17DRAFT_1333333 [Cyathus striatus]
MNMLFRDQPEHLLSMSAVDPKKAEQKNPQDDGDHDSSNNSDMKRAPLPQKKGKGFTPRGPGTATTMVASSIQPANKKGKGLVPFVQKDRVWTTQETTSNIQSANKNIIELSDDSEAEGNNVVEETAEEELSMICMCDLGTMSFSAMQSYVARQGAIFLIPRMQDQLVTCISMLIHAGVMRW